MKNILVIQIIILFFIFACSSVPKITRVDAEQQIDLSGYWNDTDSRLVSEEMVKDALTRPWIDDFLTERRTKPRVIVGNIRNRSSEHINTETFVKDLERQLLNSGRVKFVASKEQRQEIREEKMDQMYHASAATRKQLGEEFGADFILQGQINTIMDEAGKTQLKYYQVELEMINILTNEKVWIGQKQIKKIIQRPKTRF